MLVENLPGAGSTIGYEAAARAKPDGYMLLAGSDSLSINRSPFPGLAFAPVARVPQIMVVRSDSRAYGKEMGSRYAAMTGDGRTNAGTVLPLGPTSASGAPRVRGGH